MKAILHQYFRFTDTERDAFLSDALICYDANVLLNVYRYSEDTQKELVEVFKAFADRTLLPHQAALEYARNRASVIVEQVALCDQTAKALDDIVTKYITPKNKQPFLSDTSSAALKAIQDELAQKRKALESLISDDHHAELFFSIFENRVGTRPSEGDLQKLHGDAAKRYADSIPPGYSDLKTKDAPRAYGDYIVWRQLMDLAKTKAKNIIFVSDDTKEDWREIAGGRTIGTRPELLDEFHRETGQKVWIVTSGTFLEATKRKGAAKITDDAIKEVKALVFAQNTAATTTRSDIKLSSPGGEGQSVRTHSNMLTNGTSIAPQIKETIGGISVDDAKRGAPDTIASEGKPKSDSIGDEDDEEAQ
jgi:hypothetical protein